MGEQAYSFKCERLFQCPWLSHDLIKKFIDYLWSISQENYRLLLNDFESVFAAIDRKIFDASGSGDDDDSIDQLAEVLDARERRAWNQRT